MAEPDRLDELVERLERAAALVDDCARVAADAGAELDRQVRASDRADGLAGQLALES